MKKSVAQRLSLSHARHHFCILTKIGFATLPWAKLYDTDATALFLDNAAASFKCDDVIRRAHVCQQKARAAAGCSIERSLLGCFVPP